MSSFIGHALAGLMVGVVTKPSKSRSGLIDSRWWLGWLVIVAMAPDLDYILPFLHPSSHDGLRISHSLFFCQLLPILTLIYLRIKGFSRMALLGAGLQLWLASFSHLALDLLVGVTALPILFPISKELFKLPFGLLPSAGKPSLSNYYFYYNLAIELGVLMPISLCCALIKKSMKRLTWEWILVIAMLLVSLHFMNWAYGLSR